MHVGRMKNRFEQNTLLGRNDAVQINTAHAILDDVNWSCTLNAPNKARNSSMTGYVVVDTSFEQSPSIPL